MINIITVVVKNEQKGIIKKTKKKLKKKERLKYWFMSESDKEIARQRSLERYCRMKSRQL